jgi:hypothetical protein
VPLATAAGDRRRAGREVSAHLIAILVALSRESVGGWGISGLSGLVRLVAATCKEESTRRLGEWVVSTD